MCDVSPTPLFDGVNVSNISSDEEMTDSDKLQALIEIVTGIVAECYQSQDDTFVEDLRISSENIIREISRNLNKVYRDYAFYKQLSLSLVAEDTKNIGDNSRVVKLPVNDLGIFPMFNGVVRNLHKSGRSTRFYISIVEFAAVVFHQDMSKDKTFSRILNKYANVLGNAFADAYLADRSVADFK